jgi:putative glycerol-1-phosphate prenyltransferase
MYAERAGLDLFLTGGSLTSVPVVGVTARLKQLTSIPVVLFPGNLTQLTTMADAIFLLSLISGRNRNC